ncbi:P-loop containing nucleoside triphosphate hydrolase protein [Cryomyces antarcticus]
MAALKPIPPEITILLLGDADVGKSAFLSRLRLGTHAHASSTPLPPLNDADQPFRFNITLYGRPYRFAFFDTSYRSQSSSSNNHDYTTLHPSVILLCYSVSNRRSLNSIRTRWKRDVDAVFSCDEKAAVMLLGLKRDLRRTTRRAVETKILGHRGGYADPAYTPTGAWDDDDDDGDEAGSVMPHEGLRIAQELRCDRYAECSAATGELCREVFEDLARTAALTTTGDGWGGKSEGSACRVM